MEIRYDDMMDIYIWQSRGNHYITDFYYYSSKKVIL